MKFLHISKIDIGILESLKKPFLFFLASIFFVNSPFVFFDVIQHDDWNFVDGSYRNNILIHQVRLDRPLSGLLQDLIFEIWRFRDFQDFKFFRLFSIFMISIGATFIFYQLRKYISEGISFLAVLAFVCLPGFSYIILLNLLSTASLAFLLSLLAGYILCQNPIDYKKIILTVLLVIISASIHQIMSLFIILPCFIKILFEEKPEKEKLLLFCISALCAVGGNLFNILIGLLVLKPWLALKFGEIVFSPLIPTHSSNWDFFAIRNKLPVFFSDYVAFVSRFSFFEYKIPGWIIVLLILSYSFWNLIFAIFPKKIILNLLYLIAFLFICYSPFLFSNSNYYFTRSILPASGLLILYILFLNNASAKNKALSYKKIGICCFFLFNICLSFRNNFITSLGIQSEYYYIKNEFLKFQSTPDEKILFILQQPDYLKGNILGKKIFADEWNFLNFIPVGNRFRILSLIEKEKKKGFDFLAFPSEFLESFRIPIFFEQTRLINPQVQDTDLFLNKFPISLFLKNTLPDKKTFHDIFGLFYLKKPILIEEDLKLYFIVKNNSNQPFHLSLLGNNVDGIKIYDDCQIGYLFKNEISQIGNKTKTKFFVPASCKRILIKIRAHPKKTIEEIQISNEII